MLRNCIHLLLLLATLSLGNARAEPTSLFTGERCDYVEALKVWTARRGLDPTPPIPNEISPLAITPNTANQYYDIGVQAFRTYWNPEVIENLKAIAKTGPAGGIAEEKLAYAELKKARAPLKTLRFLFYSLSESHECPEALDELTKAIGSSGDIIKKRRASSDIESSSSRLLKALKPRQVEQLDQAIASFRPTDEKHFTRWFNQTVKDTKAILAKGKGTADDFHQARKNLQAILSVYQMKMAMNASDPELEKLVTYLWRDTENIGDFHETLERKSVKGKINYKKYTVPYPKEICDESLAFLKRLKMSMN